MTHTARACEKLREEGLVAGIIEVFVSTGKHPKQRWMMRKGRASVKLLAHSNDTLELTKLASQLLDQAYLEKHRATQQTYLYSKCGVNMFEIIDDSNVQNDLFGERVNTDRKELLKCIDRLNNRYGKRSIVLASMGTPDQLLGIESGSKKQVKWGMRRDRMSPRYTTSWRDVIKVK